MRAKLLLDTLTPVAKSWPAQWCLEANSLAIQVHGGYGYAREYGIEQLYRDNRLNAIHEGTHGIQGLDLLGRKTRAHGGAGLGAVLDEMRRAAGAADAIGGDASAMASALTSAIARIAEVTAAIWDSEAVEVSLANASLYLEACGHVVVAWMWLEQVVAANGKQGAFYDGKRQAAQFFFRYELPRTQPQWELLATLDRTTLDMDEAWF